MASQDATSPKRVYLDGRSTATMSGKSIGPVGILSVDCSVKASRSMSELIAMGRMMAIAMLGTKAAKSMRRPLQNPVAPKPAAAPPLAQSHLRHLQQTI